MKLRSATRALAGRIRDAGQAAAREWRSPTSPNNRTAFGRQVAPGPFVAVFDALRDLPGWFTYDDLVHFTLLLRQQTATGVTGDVLEIGAYHGRSTVALALSLAPGEELIVCDAFERDVEDDYDTTPSPELLEHNVRSRTGLPAESLTIHSCYSTELDLPHGVDLRFAHVDGGHGFDSAHHDILFAAERLVAGGVLVVDDYGHPRFPGVTRAVDTFLRGQPPFTVLGDVNRIGADGRKIYLHRSAP